MYCEFELNQKQLLDIATNLKEKIIKGVCSSERELFREYPYYREIIQTSLKSLLKALGLSRVVFQLAVETSHLLGSAIAALSCK